MKISRIGSLVLTVLSLLTLAQPADAQRRDRDRDHGEIGRGFFQTGVFELDVDDLNSALTGAGYPALDGTVYTLGGGGYGTRGRFLMGGEGHALMETIETTADGAYQVGMSGGYGMFRLGYLAFTRGGLDVFPSLGLGGGGMSLEIVERGAPTFDDVLDDPARSARLSTAMLLLDASLSVQYRVDMSRDRDDEDEDGDDRPGGLLVGVEAGYTFAPGDSTWDLDGINGVAGGPTLQVEGLHLRISIGGWGREGDDD